MIVYFTPKKYDLNVIPTGAIPTGRESEGSELFPVIFSSCLW